MEEVKPEEIRRPLGEWLIEWLRSFVDSLSSFYVEDALRTRLVEDPDFAAKLNSLAVKAGYTHGLSDLVGEDYSRTEILARMMTYVLMNKIIFYKVVGPSPILAVFAVNKNFFKTINMA